MKCLIITIHHIHNFGSVFQAYSLCRFLEENGYEAELIDYRPSYYKKGKNSFKTLIGKVLNLRAYLARKKKFENFIKTHDKLSKKRFYNFQALQKYYRQSTQIFIAGGDQLWNNYHPCGNDDAYKLTFVDNVNKIAYGTSMGRDNFNEADLKLIASKVADFDKIMLREKTSVSVFSQYTKKNVLHVIDPVGLVDIEEFKKFAKKPKMDKPYAVMYLAASSEILDKAVDILSKQLGLKILRVQWLQTKR